MSRKFLIIAAALSLLALLAIAGCASPTTTPTEGGGEVTQGAPAAAPLEVPYKADWEGSAHNDATAAAFTHWNDATPAEIPVECARCHSSAGYQDFVGADGSAAGAVDKAAP